MKTNNRKQSQGKAKDVKTVRQPVGGKHSNKSKPGMTKSYSYIVLFIILVVSFISYLPALRNGLVWDDEFYVLNNRMIHSIDLKEIFSSYVMGNYHPFTMLSYAIEYQFWGLGEKGYHLVNVLIHLANTVLVFYAVSRVSGKQEVALAASLLFGIHPMHVESVAWVAERKDLLYTFFFLGSYIYYLKYLQSRKRLFYFSCLVLFLCSLFSKAMATSLPVVLLLTDYFKEGKISGKAWLEKLPFLALSVVFGVVAVFAQQSHHAVADVSGYSLLPRIIFGCYGFITYIWKLILPINLSAYYPYPVKGGTVIPVLYYLYPVIVLALAALIMYTLRFNRKILFGIGFFTITVFLVLQFLPVGDAIIADRYSYVPSIGIFYLAGEGFYWLWSRRKGTSNQRIPAMGLLIVVAVLLCIQTSARCGVWKNGLSLWNDVINQFQTIPAAYNNRGKILLEAKNYEAALSDFNKTIEIDPEFPSVYNNRGTLLMDLGRFDEAVNDYNKAVALQPQANAYNNRGLLFIRLKRFSEAIPDLNKAIELDPNLAESYFNRAISYQNLNKVPEALSDYAQALELNPRYTDVYNNRANILMNEKRYDEALQDYNKAIELSPDPSNGYLNKGTMYYFQKKYDEAIVNYNKVIELDPNNGQAFFNKGMAEYSMGKTKECCKNLQRAIALKYEAAQNAYDLYCH